MSKTSASTGTLPPAGSGKPQATPATSDPKIEKILLQMEEMKKTLEAQRLAQETRERELDAREAKMVITKPANREEMRKVIETHKSKAEAMRDNLHSQPKVTIMIPLEQGEAEGTRTSVTLNGYRYTIQKNVYVDVPMQVAEVVMNAQKQTIAAGKDFRTDIARPAKGGVTVEEALL